MEEDAGAIRPPVQLVAETVPRVTAVAFIADQILRQVAAGGLKPGDRLPRSRSWRRSSASPWGRCVKR